MTVHIADVIARTLGPAPSLCADFPKLGTVSFDEMILPFMVESDEASSEVPGPHHPTKLALCRLISALQLSDARERELTEAVKSTQIITWSVKLLHRELVALRVRDGGRLDCNEVIHWSAEVAMVWYLLLGRAMKGGIGYHVLVQEAIETGMLFTVELWASMSHKDPSCESDSIRS